MALWLLGNLIEYFLSLNVVHDDVDLFGELVEEVFGSLDDILVPRVARNLVLLLMGQPPLFVRFAGNLRGERLLLLDIRLLVAFVDRSVRTLSQNLWRLIEYVLRAEAFRLLLLSAGSELVGLIVYEL